MFTGSPTRQWFQTCKLTRRDWVGTRQPRLCCWNISEGRLGTGAVCDVAGLQWAGVTRSGVAQALAVMMTTIQTSAAHASTQVLDLKRLLAATQDRPRCLAAATRLQTHTHPRGSQSRRDNASTQSTEHVPQNSTASLQNVISLRTDPIHSQAR